MDDETHAALQTGDLLLCHNGRSDFAVPDMRWSDWLFGVFTSLIDRFTGSPYSHVAVVLRNPGRFVPTPQRFMPDGVYVWESSYDAGVPDPQDGVVGKVGVRITPLADFLDEFRYPGSRVLHRPLRGTGVAEAMSVEALRRVHAVVYDKPYDLWPRDWYAAAAHPYRRYLRTTDRFWCSALVAYIYTKCGILSDETDWTTMRPSDFAAASDGRLRYADPARAALQSEERVICKTD